MPLARGHRYPFWRLHEARVRVPWKDTTLPSLPSVGLSSWNLRPAGSASYDGRVGDVEADLASPPEYRDGSGGQQTSIRREPLRFSGTESQESIRRSRRRSPIAASRCSGTAFRRRFDHGGPRSILGRRIHRRARRIQPRGGGCFTRFFRNLPQLELVRDMVLEMPQGAPVKIVSMGCSTGADLYSTLWLIRTARPTQAFRPSGSTWWRSAYKPLLGESTRFG